MRLALLVLMIGLMSNHISLSSYQKVNNPALFFSKLDETNNFNFDQSFIISIFSSNSEFKCLTKCGKMVECVYAAYKENNCYMCKANFSLFMTTNSNERCLIYKKKFKLTDGLINYWAFNKNVNDSIGKADLYGGVNASLTLDRFGIENSALSLKNGFYLAPPGVYFSGTEFSILVWINVRNFGFCPRIIDFGTNGCCDEDIAFSLSLAKTGKPFINIYSNHSFKILKESSIELYLNKWQHLAFVYSSPYYIYIDGKASLNKSTGFGIIPNVTRYSNYIGKSKWSPDNNADADFDDLKFYQRALNQQEIEYEMYNNL